MLKKTITYADYDGVERTESFYFNLTKAELIKMEASVDGGLQARYQRIVDAKDGRLIMEEFDKLIDAAYGVKSEDGKRFMKSKEITANFKQTPAYDELFFELCTNADAAADFIDAILPKLDGIPARADK